MGKPHVPIERDVARFIVAYREAGRDLGELLAAIGKAFPGCSYGAIGRALMMAECSGQTGGDA